MPWVIVPVSPAPDHTMSVLLETGGVKRPLILRFRYNLIGQYWWMDISDGTTLQMIASGIPLLTGDYPAANLLEQLRHKDIGGAVIAALSQLPGDDAPGMNNLGTEFALCWGDGDEVG